MIKYWKELRGRRIREAELLTHSNELTKAPVGLKQQFNSNIFIPNLAAQPAWDKDDLTVTAGAVDAKGYYSARTLTGDYVEVIVDAMLAGSGTGATSKAILNVDWLTALDLYVRTRLKLDPVSIGGRRGYVLVLSSEDCATLFNPAKSGSMGAYFAQSGDLSKAELSIPGMLGRFRSLWIVEDERAPTLTVGGANSSWTLKPGFVQPGNNDDRNLDPWSNSTGSPNYAFNVGRVLGAAALAEWVVLSTRYDAKETTEYGQLAGKGSYSLGGISAVRYDLDSGSQADGSLQARTLVNRGSCVVLTSRSEVGSVT
jgi:hypothetical protein